MCRGMPPRTRAAKRSGEALRDTCPSIKKQAEPTKRKVRKKAANSDKNNRCPQQPAIALKIHARGFESFPTHVFDACVTVDNVECGAVKEIGSGVCIAPKGLILTAGHVAPHKGNVRRVSFASGFTAPAACVGVSELFDLSLLRIQGTTHRTYSCVELASSPAAPKTKLVCVGQPGVRAKSRLEANVGKCLSQARNPLQNQQEVGAMVHDCPVYAGSSGSALFHSGTGNLVGLHTGFDLRKFEAQAVTLEAVQAFLFEQMKLSR